MGETSFKRVKVLLKSSGLTEFQKSVLIEVSRIPRGHTITYERLAKRIDHPKASRAVGTALKRNPFPIIIPCHRVVRSDGSVGQYSFGGTKAKKALLIKEGAMAKD